MKRIFASALLSIAAMILAVLARNLFLISFLTLWMAILVMLMLAVSENDLKE